MVDTVPGNAVGPSVESLKEIFGVQKVPLASNFSDLINIADAGRKAAGLSPAQDGVPGIGLQLDRSEKLAVRPKAESGVRVDGSGVGVIPDSSKGIKVDVNGVGIVADSNKGINVDASGVGVVADSNKGIKVDVGGVGVIPDANKGIKVDASGVGVVADSGKGIKVDVSGVGVIPDASRGIKVDASGVGVVADSSKGIKVDGSGVGVIPDASKGIKVDASGVGVVADSSKGIKVDGSGVGVDFGATLKVANGKLEVADSFAAPPAVLSNGANFDSIVPPNYRIGVYAVSNGYIYPNRPATADGLAGNAFLMMFSHGNSNSNDCTQIYFSAVGGMWLRAKHDGATAFTAWGRVNAVVADPAKGITVNDNVVGVNHGSSLAMVNGKLEVAPSAGIPSGLIVMFSGAAIPAGWALCDGTSGRPDLRNRFILGGSGGEVGASGGSGLSGTGESKTYSASTSQVSAGGITVAVGNTTLTVAQIPAHSHAGYFTWNTSWGAGGWTSFTQGNTQTPETRTLNDITGGNQPHTHTGSATQGTHSHSVSTLPAYYILAFIMKL